MYIGRAYFHDCAESGIGQAGQGIPGDAIAVATCVIGTIRYQRLDPPHCRIFRLVLQRNPCLSETRYFLRWK